MKKLFAFILFAFILFVVNSIKAQVFTNYTTSNSALPGDYVLGGVAVDSNNYAWFGTGSGVAMYNGSIWTTYTTTNGLPDNYIKCITVDKHNNVWVGTDGFGVSKFNGTTWTTFTTTNGLADNGVTAVIADNNNNIWFGTGGSGVSKYDGTTWTTYSIAQGFPGDAGVPASVNCITTDNQNNVWFGTDKGISKFNGTTFSNIDINNIDSLGSNYISALAIDVNNNKWIGTLSYGMTKLNSSNGWVKNYRMSDGLLNNFIQDIVFDTDGIMWIAEYADYNNEGGITKFDGITWTSYTLTDGLVNPQIMGIAVDKNKKLWIATGAGVSFFNPAVSVPETESGQEFSIYPNPASDKIYISHVEENLNVQIVTLSGQVVLNENLSQYQQCLNTLSLTPGMYLVKMTSKEQTCSSKLIIR